MVATILVAIGIVVLALGVLPMLSSAGILPLAFLNQGIIYPIILIAVGILIAIFSFQSMSLMGMSKFAAIFVGIATAALGVLPFLGSMVPIAIEGIIYYGIVTAVGVIGLIIGIQSY